MSTSKEKSKKQVHFILQGKGGVGKSVVATLLAQFLKEKQPLRCIDTDPINPTFSMFKGLEVEHLNLLSSPNKINEKKFDQLIEMVLESDQNVIIDNGSGGFLAISNYIIENDIIQTISGLDIFVHVPVTGGQAFEETINGLISISNQFDEKAKIVIWINEYFGKLEKELESFNFFKKFDRQKHAGTITIPELTADTFGEDIKMMLSSHKTFNEIRIDENLKFMEKHRLNLFRKQIFEQLEKAELCA